MALEWYILHVRPGTEEDTVRLLQKEVERHAEDFRKLGYEPREVLRRVSVPKQEVERKRRGKRVLEKRLIYPRYVFVEMDYNSETSPLLSRIIRSLGTVLGIIGGWENPQPLSDEEQAELLRLEGMEVSSSEVDIRVGDTVRILSGPFADFTGTVEEISVARNKVRVRISLFGRETPVEVELTNIRRM